MRRLTSLDKVWLLSHGQELLICPHWCRLTMKMPFHWPSASQACCWEEGSEQEPGLLPSPAPRHVWLLTHEEWGMFTGGGHSAHGRDRSSQATVPLGTTSVQWKVWPVSLDYSRKEALVF